MRRHSWRRQFGVPAFGLQRQIFFSLFGAMISAGLLALCLSLFWNRIAAGMAVPSAWKVVVVAFCVMPSLWFASGRLAWRLARPLDRLVEVVQRFGKGDHSARTGFAGRSRSEVARVALAIDEMAERIERQMREEQQLLAVVSHELRTPLARIRVLTDLAREGQRASLDDIDREISEVDYLVSNILARSRLEFGTLAKKPLRLTEAVSEALDRAGLDASLLSAQSDGEEKPITADPTLLHRAIANLIDNAQRHGKGIERMEVRSTATAVALEVLDRGPGFAQIDPKLRFEAFGPDGGGGRGQGLGIGLNLVRQIVANLGGEVWAENRAEGGARVGFRVPV
jgi:two-component system OmpR family sensor kinase